jgi:hypothetical protein
MEILPVCTINKVHHADDPHLKHSASKAKHLRNDWSAPGLQVYHFFSSSKVHMACT